MTYRYCSNGPLWQAVVIFATALVMVVLLPDADLKLLAGLFALAPLAWAGYEWSLRKSGLTLQENALTLRHPLALRPLRIPYERIAGIHPWPQPPSLGLVYYVPRPPFEGEPDPRPPRVCAASTLPLVDFPAAAADLRQRLEQSHTADPAFPALSDDALCQRLRARRARRRLLGAAVLLASPVLTILAIRVVIEVARIF